MRTSGNACYVAFAFSTRLIDCASARMPATRGLVTGWLSAVVGRSRSIQQAADAGLEVIRSITTDADAAMIRTSV